MAMAKKTTWLPARMKPVREGWYEAKEKGTGHVFDVRWKKLTDEAKPGFYTFEGVFGPFLMWKDASDRMWQWRGLTERDSQGEAKGGRES